MISALDFEYEYVHTAYELLARHIDPVVHKRWPFVEEFLKRFPDGSLLADVGCGEGKYLKQNSRSFMIGSDRSTSLSVIAQSNGSEIATCDVTKMPFRDASFDGVICISVIHHLATEARRVKALKELCRILRPGGVLLITGWALENKYRKFICQDVLVPAEVAERRPSHDSEDPIDTHQSRHPLVYVQEQANRLTTKISGFHEMLHKEVQSFKTKLKAASSASDSIHHYVTNRKRSFWLWVEDKTLLSKLGVIFRGNIRKSHSLNDLTASKLKYDNNEQERKNSTNAADCENDAIKNGIHRYYHVFQKGELGQLIQNHVPMLETQNVSFAQGNWVLTAKKL